MSYTNQPPTEKSRLAREHAYLRTVAGTAEERARPAAAKAANKEKERLVELDRRHFQKELDDYKDYANGEIAKAWAEADHWREQVRIIYELLEEQTGIAKDALTRLAQYETVKPVVEVVKPSSKPKHKKGVSNATRRKYEET